MKNVIFLTHLRPADPDGMGKIKTLVNDLRHHHPEARIKCLGNQPVAGVDTLMPIMGLPEEWSIVELFRPGILPWGDDALYIHPDCRIEGNLSHIVEQSICFSTLHTPRSIDTSVMRWKVGLGSVIYTRFAANPHIALRTPGGFPQWISDHMQHIGDLKAMSMGDIMTAAEMVRATHSPALITPPPGKNPLYRKRKTPCLLHS